MLCPKPLGSFLQEIQKILRLKQHPELAELAAKGFSKTTWQARLRVWRALKRDRPLKDATLKFIKDRLRKGLKPGTVAKDLGHIKWILRLEQVSDGYLDATMTALQKALRAQEAVIPTEKALPMSKQFLKAILRSRKIDRDTKIAILLAHKAGARVNDVFALRPETAFQRMKTGEMLICWGITKTHRTVEARPDHQQIIKHPGILTTLIDDPNILRRTSPSAVRRALALMKPPRSYVAHWQRLNRTVKIRAHFTFHSMKRGRAAILWDRAAQGVIPVATVMRELKHKSVEAALAYGPSPAATALAIRREEESLKSAHATNTSSQPQKRWSKTSKK